MIALALALLAATAGLALVDAALAGTAEQRARQLPVAANRASDAQLRSPASSPVPAGWIPSAGIVAAALHAAAAAAAVAALEQRGALAWAPLWVPLAAAVEQVATTVGRARAGGIARAARPLAAGLVAALAPGVRLFQAWERFVGGGRARREEAAPAMADPVIGSLAGPLTVLPPSATVTEVIAALAQSHHDEALLWAPGAPLLAIRAAALVGQPDLAPAAPLARSIAGFRAGRTATEVFVALCSSDDASAVVLDGDGRPIGAVAARELALRWS